MHACLLFYLSVQDLAKDHWIGKFNCQYYLSLYEPNKKYLQNRVLFKTQESLQHVAFSTDQTFVLGDVDAPIILFKFKVNGSVLVE